jgi:hypothetical protein
VLKFLNDRVRVAGDDLVSCLRLLIVEDWPTWGDIGRNRAPLLVLALDGIPADVPMLYSS